MLRANSDNIDGCLVNAAKVGNDLVGMVLVEDTLHNILLSDNAEGFANRVAVIVAPLLRPLCCEIASGNESGRAREATVVFVFFRGLPQ